MIAIAKDANSFHDLLPIFATKEFLATQSDEFGWLRENGLLLPWFIRKRFGFRQLIFTQHTIFLGEEAGIGRERTFLNDVVRFAKSALRADMIVQSLNHVHFRVMPDGAIGAPFGSYQIDLSFAAEELLARMHQKHRNVVRKAQRDGVVIHFGSDQRQKCIELFRATMQREGMSCPEAAYFERLHAKLENQIKFVIASKDGEPQAAAMIPWNRHAGYYLWGGSVAAPYGGSANLMHWEIMKRLKAQSVKMYDFVGARINPGAGSKLEGIQRFKCRFGATMNVGYLWKMPLTHKCYLYNALRKLKNTGKGDIIDQERRKEKADSADI